MRTDAELEVLLSCHQKATDRHLLHIQTEHNIPPIVIAFLAGAFAVSEQSLREILWVLVPYILFVGLLLWSIHHYTLKACAGYALSLERRINEKMKKHLVLFEDDLSKYYRLWENKHPMSFAETFVVICVVAIYTYSVVRSYQYLHGYLQWAHMLGIVLTLIIELKAITIVLKFSIEEVAKKFQSRLHEEYTVVRPQTTVTPKA